MMTSEIREYFLTHFVKLTKTTISPALFPAITVTMLRDKKIRTALRTNQITGFVTVPSLNNYSFPVHGNLHMITVYQWVLDNIERSNACCDTLYLWTCNIRSNFFLLNSKSCNYSVPTPPSKRMAWLVVGIVPDSRWKDVCISHGNWCQWRTNGRIIHNKFILSTSR